MTPSIKRTLLEAETALVDLFKPETIRMLELDSNEIQGLVRAKAIVQRLIERVNAKERERDNVPRS